MHRVIPPGFVLQPPFADLALAANRRQDGVAAADPELLIVVLVWQYGEKETAELIRVLHPVVRERVL